MKKLLAIVLAITVTATVYAKKIDFVLTNKNAYQVQVFYQIIEKAETMDPEYIFNLAAVQQRT